MYPPRILFVAPSCYPIDGAEANVNAKVIKTLTDSGCIVDLVSRKTTKSLCYPKTDDDFYFSKIRNIIEVDWYTGKDLKQLWNHAKVFLLTGYTYIWADWAYPAIKACEELIKKNEYDYIYTYNAPSEIVGVYISKKYGVKWVATWNDPYCWAKYPSPYGKGVDASVPFISQRLIDTIGKYVYRNIFPSSRLRDYMLKYIPHIEKESCVICPHIVLDTPLKNETDRGVLQILHAGALGRERNPMTFLKGLKTFLDNNPEAKIEVTFLGVFERSDGSDSVNYINENNLGKYVRMLPPVNYNDSLKIISDYHVCMLIEAPCEEGIFLPSKVADYMQCNKPIFAVSPLNGTMNDMYKKGEIGYFADVRDYNEVYKALDKIHEDFKNKKLRKTENAVKLFGAESFIETQKTEIWT